MSRPKVPGYVLTEKLGSGSFADVYKAYLQNDSKEIVAIKCIRKGSLSTFLVDSIVTEISLLKQLKHPYIVQMKDFTWDEGYIFIVMEYCSGGDLSSFIKSRQRLSESTCRRFLQQLSLALEYLRGHNVAHMDLKPQNLLLSSKTCPSLKIADFGLARTLAHNQTENAVRGSPLYMAPEILLQKSYDASVDLWSVGVILYECLFGRPPYSSQTLAELVDKIKTGAPIKIPGDVNISPECRDLLKRLLKRNPDERISFDEFFNHPFFTRNQSTGVSNESKAAALISKAKEEEARDNPSLALSLYCEALDLYIPLVQRERDVEKKSRLQAEIDHYIDYAEQLKAATSTSSIPRITTTSNDTFKELLQLSNSTPSLKSAIEIAIAAVQYDAESHFPAALERYQMALEKLLLLLRNEPKGRRKDLLYQQISVWMSRAEKIKRFLECRDLRQALDPSLDEVRDSVRACIL